MKPESLLKVLTAAGLGSRRKMADAIKYERVTVNGAVVTDFRHPVNTAKDDIATSTRRNTWYRFRAD
jgi:23S rRNA pseudouridine2605 synthase